MPLQLSRRTFLRGLGVSMALPMLEAMVPRNLYAGPADTPPTRLLVFYVPNGIRSRRGHLPRPGLISIYPLFWPLWLRTKRICLS